MPNPNLVFSASSSYHLVYHCVLGRPEHQTDDYKVIIDFAMTPRAQEPKRKKIKRSSMQDYAVVDRPYRAPHNRHFTPEESGSDNSHPLRRKQKHGEPNSKRSAVRRPKNKNAKDPFDCLVDDVVGIIVSLLPVQATETLRRVSRLWKATSEYHNDIRAIRRHFNYLGEGLKSFDSKEEANLHFRRLREYCSRSTQLMQLRR